MKRRRSRHDSQTASEQLKILDSIPLPHQPHPPPPSDTTNPKMQLLLTTLPILAAASLAAAAPAPQPLDERGPPATTVWSIAGYANPNCKGVILWTETGSGIACQNFPRLAASYSWVAASPQPIDITSWAEPGVCGNPSPGTLTAPRGNRVPAAAGEAPGNGCLSTAAYSIMVIPAASLNEDKP
jgi:hypothetical protein